MEVITHFSIRGVLGNTSLGTIASATALICTAEYVTSSTLAFSGSTPATACKNDRNVMRVHIQSGTQFTYPFVKGLSVLTNPDGVSTRQVRDLMSIYWLNRSSISFLPPALHSWLATSIVGISQDLKRYPLHDGYRGRRISLIDRQISFRGRNYRIDVDALSGHNLKR